MERWDRQDRREEPTDQELSYGEFTPIMLRRKGKKRRKLTNKDKVSISYKAIVKQEKYADIAKEYWVSPSRISTIVKPLLKNPELLYALDPKKEEKQARIRSIKRILE